VVGDELAYGLLPTFASTFVDADVGAGRVKTVLPQRSGY
jgi:hypothetical protein